MLPPPGKSREPLGGLELGLRGLIFVLRGAMFVLRGCEEGCRCWIWLRMLPPGLLELPDDRG